VLFLDAMPGSVDRNSILGLPIAAEFADWDTYDIGRLRRPDFDLLVAVAATASANASAFFESLMEKPGRHPTLAIFTPEDKFLRKASRMVDDFIVAPVRGGELLHRVSRILGDGTGEFQERAIQDKLSGELGFSGLVGAHPSFLRVLKQIALAARSNCSVIFTGETGTGKELCARALHHLGARRS
jgi:DNA-binding NtrC family response regulator